MTPEDLILRLPQMAEQLPVHEFPGRVLTLLETVLPFDSGVWNLAAAVDGLPLVHEHHDFRTLPNWLEEFYPLVHLDPLQPRLQSEPLGTTVHLCVDQFPEDELEPLRRLALKHGRYHILCTMQAETGNHLLQVIALFRADPQNPFLDTERQLKQRLMPHLAEALRLNRRQAIRRQLMDHFAGVHGVACADRDGILREAEPHFTELLQREWPDWRDARLPAPLVAGCAGEGEWQHAGRAALVRARPRNADEWLLVASEAGPLGRLTGREWEIARRYAAGETYKAVAEDLALSPTTVRNHLARVYRKLGVNHRAALRALLE